MLAFCPYNDKGSKQNRMEATGRIVLEISTNMQTDGEVGDWMCLNLLKTHPRPRYLYTHVLTDLYLLSRDCWGRKPVYFLQKPDIWAYTVHNLQHVIPPDLIFRVFRGLKRWKNFSPATKYWNIYQNINVPMKKLIIRLKQSIPVKIKTLRNGRRSVGARN